MAPPCGAARGSQDMRAVSRTSKAIGGRATGGRLVRWATVGIVPMVAVVGLAVPVSEVGAAATAAATTMASTSTTASTFQIAIDGQSFTASLPTSSVGTYVRPAGSSTLT